eukprot:s2039_g19.t1
MTRAMKSDEVADVQMCTLNKSAWFSDCFICFHALPFGVSVLFYIVYKGKKGIIRLPETQTSRCSFS